MAFPPSNQVASPNTYYGALNHQYVKPPFAQSKEGVLTPSVWKSVTREDAASYNQACEEKQLHFQQHPDWSHINNHGKKRKRVRGKAATRAKAAAPHHEEEALQMDQRSLASTQAPLCPTHTELMQTVCRDGSVATATTAPLARESSDSDCESTGSLAPIEDILDVVNVKLLSGPALTPDAAGTELRSVCQGDAIGPTSLLRSPRTAAHSAIDSSSSGSDSGGSLAPIEDILGMLDVNAKVSQSAPEHSQAAITESQSQCDLVDFSPTSLLAPLIPVTAVTGPPTTQAHTPLANINVLEDATKSLASPDEQWKSMSWEDKAAYYKQACEEKQLHFQQHPDWSHINNHGKKRRRVRGKAATRAKAAAPHHEEQAPQMDQRSLASAQAPLCPTHTELMQTVCRDGSVATATTTPSARESSDSDCESTGSLAPIEDILDVVNVKLLSGPAPNAVKELHSVSEMALSASLAPPSPEIPLPHFARDSSNSDCESAGSLAPIENILGRFAGTYQQALMIKDIKPTLEAIKGTMRDSPSNQMADPSNDGTADPSVSHLPLLHPKVYLSAHQMADPSANDEPINNQMVGPSTYFKPLNYQMDRISSYCMPLNYQIHDPSAYYGPLNYQMQDLSTYYGPLTYQMACPNTYYGPMNYQHVCPYSQYGTLNARHSFDHNSHPRLHAPNRNLSNRLALSDIPTAAALTEPSASPQLNGNSSVCMPPKCVGLVNEEMVHRLEGSPAAAAPAQNTASATSQSNSATQRSKAEEQLHSERPHIKKPSNAFMLFMRELRPKVMAQCKITNNASVNVILGQRWKSMSWEEKAPYYKQACEEKQLHFQQHPDWSHTSNYAKKRKRVRGKAATRAKAAAPHHEEEAPQTDQGSLASARAGTTEAPLCPTHAELMQAVCQDGSVAAATTAPSARESSDRNLEPTKLLTIRQEFFRLLEDVELLSPPAKSHLATGSESSTVCEVSRFDIAYLLDHPQMMASCHVLGLEDEWQQILNYLESQQ